MNLTYFTEFFLQTMSYEELLEKVSQKTTFVKSEFLDSIYLHEAITFLRRSIFNLLSYRYLLRGNHLPMAKVSLYYCFFDSISSLLRMRGTAIVHFSEITKNFEDEPRKIIFTITHHENHTFTINRVREKEHRMVWNVFHDLFPDLSSRQDGRWFTKDRYEWNYGLVYSSQATEEYAQAEIKDRRDNNFLDSNFESSESAEEAEHKEKLIANYGYEEMYAGKLIQESIKLLTAIAKTSEYKKDYIDSFKKMEEGINFLESDPATKEEIKKWLNCAITELDQQS